MADPTTPYKGLTEPAVGGDNNAWGALLNTDLVLIDQALGGTLSLSIAGATNLTGAQAQNTGYVFTGSLGSTANIVWPSFYGSLAVYNNTTGGHSLSCGISGAFVTVTNGESVGLWSDGTNFYRLAQAGGGGGLITGAQIASATITGSNIASATLTGSLIAASTITGSNISGATITGSNIANSTITNALLASGVYSNITGVGTITSGTWNGSIISPTYGGTGVNNGAHTLSLSANVAISGALTTTGSGSITLAFPGSNNTYTYPTTSATLAPTGSPTFGGTVTNPDASTHAANGLQQVVALGVLSNAGSGNINISGQYQVAGTQIATTNLSDVTAPTTWTPTDGSGASLSLTVATALYTKIGKMVTLLFDITYPVTASGAIAQINGLPAIPKATTNQVQIFDINNATSSTFTNIVVLLAHDGSSSSFQFAAINATATPLANSVFSGLRLTGAFTYMAN